VGNVDGANGGGIFHSGTAAVIAPDIANNFSSANGRRLPRRRAKRRDFGDDLIFGP